MSSDTEQQTKAPLKDGDEKKKLSQDYSSLEGAADSDDNVQNDPEAKNDDDGENKGEAEDKNVDGATVREIVEEGKMALEQNVMAEETANSEREDGANDAKKNLSSDYSSSEGAADSDDDVQYVPEARNDEDDQDGARFYDYEDKSIDGAACREIVEEGKLALEQNVMAMEENVNRERDGLQGEEQYTQSE